jgi:formylglycine-generating enzyme required for sulfatase activity
MKKVFILLGAAFLAGGAFGEVLSNAPANGNAYTCPAYSCVSISVEMVFVKGGTLYGTSTTVEDFYIGKYEVTQKQWREVMGTTINDMYAKRTNQNEKLVGVGDNYPMYFVTWDDAQAFIAKLNVAGGNFRLPTDAEWEYAARGGSPQQHYDYAGSSTISSVAWFSGNANSTTHPVDDNATKAANGIGAYHMSGNVWEWCQDWYTVDYCRVRRGGSWGGVETLCTVSHRDCDLPTYRGYGNGFRLVCSPNP